MGQVALLRSQSAVSQSESTGSQLGKRKKAPKGTVSIQVFKERLRLCWSYQGKRYFLYLGLPDGKTNWIVAEGKAKQIEGDIATGNFDSTLAKYKPAHQSNASITVVELFEKFIKHKAKQVYKQTLVKYQAQLGHLKQFFRDKSVGHLGEGEAEQFKAWLSKRITAITLHERITLMRACWEWGIKQNLAEVNPWLEVLKSVRVPPQQKPKPFTREEIEKILKGFRGDRYSWHRDDRKPGNSLQGNCGAVDSARPTITLSPGSQPRSCIAL